MKDCILLVVDLVVLHVSAPYKRIDLTLELKSPIFVLVDNTFEFYMFFS